MHHKELQELRNENDKLSNDIKDNLEQHNASIELKDSELKQFTGKFPNGKMQLSVNLPIIEIL